MLLNNVNCVFERFYESSKFKTIKTSRNFLFLKTLNTYGLEVMVTACYFQSNVWQAYVLVYFATAVIYARKMFTTLILGVNDVRLS